MNNEEKIWTKLRSFLNNNDYGVAGLMGNLQAESGLNPKNLQNSYEKRLDMNDETYTKAVDNGTYNNFIRDTAGYGLAQWTYWSRKQNLLNFAKKAKTSIGDLDMQLDFLYQELQVSYPIVLNGLMKAKSVREASNLVLLGFEKPADQSINVQNKRAKMGESLYEKYSKNNDFINGESQKNEDMNMNKEVKIIQSFLTKNPCYKVGKKIAVKGLMLHSVGCPQPSAQVFVRNWNSASYSRACVHAFIDANSGDAYQTLPWDMRGWHCGGSGNNTHIGVEMCEPSSIVYSGGTAFKCNDLEKAKADAKRTYKSAVKLFAKLCKQYGLNPLDKKVILSHKEGYAQKIASNHGDPEHLWKGLGLSYTMDTFRNDVARALGQNSQPAQPSSPALPRLVKVTADALNIRSGPNSTYTIKGTIRDKGTYTIVEEYNGWGKLKSGIGWISLKYTVNK